MFACGKKERSYDHDQQCKYRATPSAVMSRTTSSNHGGPIGRDKSDAWRKATINRRSNAIGSPSVTSCAMNAKPNRRMATYKVGAQDFRCPAAFCHSVVLMLVA